LDEKLLQTYLDSINFHRDDPDLVLIDQLATIKSLINRKTYSLSDKQIKLIHDRFKNLADQRNKYTFLKEKEREQKNHEYEQSLRDREFNTPQVDRDPKNSARGPQVVYTPQQKPHDAVFTNKFGYNPDVEKQKEMDQKILNKGYFEHEAPKRNTYVLEAEKPKKKPTTQRSVSAKRYSQPPAYQAHPRVQQPQYQQPRPVAHY